MDWNPENPVFLSGRSNYVSVLYPYHGNKSDFDWPQDTRRKKYHRNWPNDHSIMSTVNHFEFWSTQIFAVIILKFVLVLDISPQSF